MKFFLALTILFISFNLQAQEIYTIADIPLDLLENANSVILEEKTEIDVSADGKQIMSTFIAVAVLNKKGDNVVRSFVAYDEGIKVKKVEAIVYDALGNEIEHYRKREFRDVSYGDGYSIYSDDRALYINYIPTTYPYVFIFNFETESNTTAFIRDWYPVKGYSTSTKKSTYKIKFDSANKPRIKKDNLEGYEISISENPNEIICKAEKINALVFEELSPSFSKNFPNVSFSLNKFTLKGVSGYAENWKEFGFWMQKSLLDDVSDLPESTIVKVENLIKNETTNQAKARLIYNYLQEKVRYVSVQIGIGGWKPMLASEVDKLSYGDCKALTNYTKALLDAVGIPSYYTILYADEEKLDVDKEFSRIWGNHAILGVPDDDEITWLECTSQDKPFGYIGVTCDDRDVLIVTPEGGEIVHTKNYNFSENLEETFVEVVINRKGGAKANYKSTSKGIRYGEKYRIVNKKQEDIDKFYKNKWDAINGYTIDNLQLTNDKENIIFTEDLQINIPSYCISVGDDILVNVNLFNQNNDIPSRIRDRKYDLYISRGFEDRNTITITIPQEFKIGDLPADNLIENKFGSYSVSYQPLSENEIEYSRQLIIKKGTFPPEEYKNYRSFRRKISKLDNTKIVVTKNI